MRRSALTLALCTSAILLTSMITSAVADVAQDVATLMQQMRNDESINSKAVDAAPPREVLTELWKYLNDPSENVRWYTMALARGIAERSTDQALKQEAVELVLTGIEAEPLPALARMVAGNLISLPRSTFSGRAKAILARLMSRPRIEPQIVRLAGVANLYTARPIIQALAGRPGGAVGPLYVNRGAALWALARMGDKAALQSVMAELEADPHQWMRALQQAAYLRQPQGVAFLVRYLFSDVTYPAQDDVPVVKPARNALLYLGEIIEGFPRETLGGSDEQLARARQWVQQQGVANLRIRD